LKVGFEALGILRRDNINDQQHEDG